MKFSCERCGKRYATADTPAPRRVYKLKCKACGHLIVVRASAETQRPAAEGSAPAGTSLEPGRTPAPVAAEVATATPSPSLAVTAPAPPPLPEIQVPPSPREAESEISLEIAPPQRTGGNGSTATPFAADATTEISMPEITAAPPPAAAPAEDLGPPAGDGGYVDLFSDLGGSGASPLAKDDEKPDDPFLAAARASLPDGYGSTGTAPDPFAPLREDAPQGLDQPPPRTPPAVPKVPVIPKPPQQQMGVPIALIGGGAAVLVGILAFVLLTAGKEAPPVPAPPVAAAPVQPAPPPPVPAPAPAVAQAPAPAEPEPPAEQAPPPPAPAKEARRPPEDDRRQREERRRAREEQQREAREREARAREERERERRAREERQAREQERREADRLAAAAVQDEAQGGLSQAQVDAVLRSTKKAFDQCLQSARGSEPKLDGRRVMLRLNIQPAGTVTYPTLDDVTLNGTELGACLKSAARLMVFPKFKGDTMHVEVPLVLR